MRAGASMVEGAATALAVPSLAAPSTIFAREGSPVSRGRNRDRNRAAKRPPAK
jgi:hypothetical protein